MTAPKLIVTLSARSVTSARRELRSAVRDGADAAEVRFDRWTARARRSAGRLFPSPLPLLATFRSRAEGGEGPTEVAPRRRVLRALRDLPFEWVDREVARDPPPAHDQAGRSIGSRHLAAPVDWGRFDELHPRGRAVGEWAKTIAPATVAEYLAHLSRLGSPAGESAGTSVLLAAGPAGALSRVWSDRTGSAAVFCSLSDDPRTGTTAVEPSQVPVDRMRSVLSGQPSGPLFALLGHPVAHSPSPRLHHGWLRADGRAGAYVAIDIETEREYRDLWPNLADGGFRGINVTHPWKILAQTVADDSEPAAARAQAANCLTFADGRWTAALTDADAVHRRLLELRTAGAWDGEEVTILGGGGAARAALVAAERLGVRARVVVRRTGEATELLHRFPHAALGRPRARGGLLIHATPVGRAGSGPLDPGLRDAFRPGSYVLDFVYRPDRPEIAEAAAAVGAAYEDGRRLLLYQAQESYRRWTGHSPPVDREGALP